MINNLDPNNKQSYFKLLNQRSLHSGNTEKNSVHSMFQYNTTIVDLNPFQKERNHDRPKSSPYKNLKLDQNDALLNKIVSQKKFFVNKNMSKNFYEPVKDAEMLANIDFLRSKLQTQPLPSANLNKSKTKDQNKANLFLNNKSKTIINDAVEINSFKTFGFDEEDYSNDLHYALDEMKKNESLNNSKDNNELLEDRASLKSQTVSSSNSPLKPVIVINENLNPHYANSNSNLNSKTDDYNDRNFANQSKFSDGFPTKTQSIVNPSGDSNATDNKHRYEDFSELKRFARQNRKSCSDKAPTKSSANLSKSDPTNRLTSATKLKNNRFPSDNNLNNNNNNKKSNSFEGSNPLIIGNPYLLSKNFNQIIRRSNKCRLENIYKPLDYHLEHSKTQIQLKKGQNDTYSPRSQVMVNNSPNNNNTNNNSSNNGSSVTETEVEYKESLKNKLSQNNLTLKKSNTFIEPNESAMVCSDPNCEFKSLITNINVQSKKEYPNERYQRMKKAEVQTIQNIIGDIPSTLNTMSQIGRVTNIEKLISNALADFYTNKSSRLVN